MQKQGKVYQIVKKHTFPQAIEANSYKIILYQKEDDSQNYPVAV